MPRTRTQNAKRNIAGALLYRVVALLSTFVTRTVIVYLMGAAYAGLSSLFSAVLQILSLAELGFGSAMVFSMYKPIAEGNARINGADVRFVKSDCFAALAGEQFDMIVSNPPSIDRQEMETLMPEVKREPALALYGGEDGLDFYRRISREAGAHLCDGGVLLFEIGWKQKDAVAALLARHIGEPFALRDYGDNWRVVGAVKERRDA